MDFYVPLFMIMLLATMAHIVALFSWLAAVEGRIHTSTNKLALAWIASLVVVTVTYYLGIWALPRNLEEGPHALMFICAVLTLLVVGSQLVIYATRDKPTPPNNG